jgi:hypothetical protein
MQTLLSLARPLGHLIEARFRSAFKVIARSAMEPCRLPAPAHIPVRRPPSFARVFTVALSSVIAFAGVASAQETWRPSPPTSNFNWNVDGRLVDVSVLVDGSTAPLYTKSGAWDRRYFQAFRGRNYSLVVRNNTGRRVGVLIAVDGLNVVTGDRSTLSGREPMYVLDPYESATIRGWRTSLNDVRRFVFVDEQRSYAERTGQANGDMGWIRVNAFREVTPLAWRDWDTKIQDGGKGTAPNEVERGRDEGSNEPRAQAEGARPAPATPDVATRKGEAGQLHAAPETESNPGTGWGEQRWDPVQRTEFVAERNATDRITLRYEYESGLRALGIFPRRTNRTWERENGELGFAPPPRW